MIFQISKTLGLAATVLVMVGCVPQVNAPQVSVPFSRGDQWKIHAQGSNINNGDTQTISVVLPAKKSDEYNYYYTIAYATGRSAFMYYYPDDDAIAVYVFLDKDGSPSEDIGKRKALLCIVSNEKGNWSGFWAAGVLDKLLESIEKETLSPQGGCNLSKQDSVPQYN